MVGFVKYLYGVSVCHISFFFLPAIRMYANSRSPILSAAKTARYTGIIPMPAACWICPKTIGINVLPMYADAI